MDYGKLIKQARKDAGLTQPELAAACGWFRDDGEPSQSRLSHYETNKRPLTLEDAETIAAALGKTLLQLLSESGPPSVPGVQPPQRLRPEIHTLVKAVSPLKDQQILDVIGYAMRMRVQKHEGATEDPNRKKLSPAGPNAQGMELA